MIINLIFMTCHHILKNSTSVYMMKKLKELLQNLNKNNNLLMIVIHGMLHIEKMKNEKKYSHFDSIDLK